MKVAVIVPNSTMADEAVDQRRRFLLAKASAGTEVVFWRNEAGPASIESEAEREEAGVEILRHARRAGTSDLSALIPWCAADPGLDALREAFLFPVVGPLMAACHAAMLMGGRFSIVTPLASPNMMRRLITSYGFADKLVSIRLVDQPVLQLREDLNATKRRFGEQVDLCAADGADAVILGCMGAFGLAEQLEARLPVVDPAVAAMTLAESMVRLGLGRRLAN